MIRRPPRSTLSSSSAASDVYKRQVVLYLLKGKAFEITYVRLKFHSSRPESFAIYRRTNESSADWTPYQFYSSTCRPTYGMSAERTVSSDNEARAICRDDFSDISPLSGASVAFSTLEGRPSAYNFDNSAELQVSSEPSVSLCSVLKVNSILCSITSSWKAFTGSGQFSSTPQSLLSFSLDIYVEY